MRQHCMKGGNFWLPPRGRETREIKSSRISARSTPKEILQGPNSNTSTSRTRSRREPKSSRKQAKRESSEERRQAEIQGPRVKLLRAEPVILCTRLVRQPVSRVTAYSNIARKKNITHPQQEATRRHPVPCHRSRFPPNPFFD